MFASTRERDLSLAERPRGGWPGEIARDQAESSGRDDLARRSMTGDAGTAPASAVPQQEGHPMSQSSNGNGSHGPTGAANAPGDSPFNKPAPEGAAKKVSEVLGEIAWLMSQSPLHKQFFISDLEWFVMTPVLLQQFRMFYDKDKPIGVVFWATVNEEVEQRLAAGTSRLRPQDWKSGDRLWVVEAIAPFGGAQEMVKDLKAKVFAERKLNFLTVGPDGREVLVV
jgi:cytolysin-activating lysine-acyltransferase